MVNRTFNRKSIEDGIMASLGAIRHAVEHQSGMTAWIATLDEGVLVEDDEDGRRLKVTLTIPFRDSGDVYWGTLKQLLRDLKGGRVLVIH